MAAAPSINDLLINAPEMNSLFRLDASGNPAYDLPFTGIPMSILEKIRLMSQLINPVYNIDPQTYPNLFLTSDIHADLEKFTFILHKIGIIDRYYTTHPDNVSMPGYVSTLEELIDFMVNFNVVNESRLALVIIGDLVDGKRSAHPYEVRDNFGNIEILLHIFIYNLRIKSILRGSNVFFTIGNHDYHTVINDDYNASTDFIYRNYVHTTAKMFFGGVGNRPDIGWTNRRNSLLPFYSLSPYLVLGFGVEVICVHGGLHNPGNNMTDILMRIQHEMYTSRNYLGVLLRPDVKAFIASERPPSPIWTRYYSNGTEREVCDSINGDNIFYLTVVGHCPTDTCSRNGGYMQQLEGIDRQRCRSIGGTDQDNGCVLFGCKDGENAPRLAFVDITMSTAFRAQVSDSNRHNEVLLLSHSDKPENEGSRYYNIMSSLTSLEPLLINIVWTQQAPLRATAPVLNEPMYNWRNLEEGSISGGRKKIKKTKKNKRRQGTSRKVLKRK